MVPRIVLVHDSVRQTVTVVCWVRTEEGVDGTALYNDAVRRIEDIIAILKGPVPAAAHDSMRGFPNPHVFTSNMEPERFRAMVERAKDYIVAGDIIQVVLSQRFHTETEIEPTVLYRALRHINPSPYLFFLKFGDLVQIGSSPEILVRKEDRMIELRPIAGTRPRGATMEEDQRLEQELLADPKERAEHLMLVDLAAMTSAGSPGTGRSRSGTCW